MTRREARAKRAQEDAAFYHRLALSQERATATLKRLTLALSDQRLVKALAKQTHAGIPTGLLSADRVTAKHRIDPTVQFLIVWKFLYPLLSDQTLVRTLDQLSPGLVQEVKDAFIAIIMDGPGQPSPPKRS